MLEEWQWILALCVVAGLGIAGWVVAWILSVNSGLKDDLLQTYREAWGRWPVGAKPPTTTPASQADPLGAAFMRLVEQGERVATSPGSQASSSPPKIPGSSRLLTDTDRVRLSHVARCSVCQAQPEQLLSLSRMLARAAAGLTASTSASEDTSLSVAPEADPATSGSNRFSDGPTDFDDPRRCRSMIAGFSCIRWSGHKDGHAMTWDDELAAATNEGREVDYGPPGSQARDGWSEHGPARTAAGHLQA